MRLFDLGLQIDRVGKAEVQQHDDAAPDVLRKVYLRLVHLRSFDDDFQRYQPFCQFYIGPVSSIMNAEEKTDVGGGVHGEVFHESHFHPPAAA